jgi:hypothetical protein
MWTMSSGFTYPKKGERLTLLPYDILYVIFLFLSYPERANCLRLCRAMKGVSLSLFSGYETHRITWPGRTDVSYLLVYHPYSSPCLHPHTYLGHQYIAIILYDTPYSYYHFRCIRPYEEGKTLRDYLSEYNPETDHVNRVVRFVDL